MVTRFPKGTSTSATHEAADAPPAPPDGLCAASAATPSRAALFADTDGVEKARSASAEDGESHIRPLIELI